MRDDGLSRTLAYSPHLASVPVTIQVTSPAFVDGGTIPETFTDDGDGLSPPVVWSGVPDAAESVLLLIEDADATTAAPLMLALVWDLPARDGSLQEGAIPTEGAEDEPDAAMLETATDYGPPDPPPGEGSHRYAFQVFALGRRLAFDGRPGREELLAAMRGWVIAKGVLVGVYGRE